MKVTSRLIEVIVAPNGETKIETKGFAGAECQEASRFIEQALGERTAERLTADFYTQQTDSATLKQSG